MLAVCRTCCHSAAVLLQTRPKSQTRREDLAQQQQQEQRGRYPGGGLDGEEEGGRRTCKGGERRHHPRMKLVEKCQPPQDLLPWSLALGAILRPLSAFSCWEVERLACRHRSWEHLRLTRDLHPSLHGGPFLRVGSSGGLKGLGRMADLDVAVACCLMMCPTCSIDTGPST